MNADRERMVVRCPICDQETTSYDYQVTKWVQYMTDSPYWSRAPVQYELTCPPCGHTYVGWPKLPDMSRSVPDFTSVIES